MRAQLSYANVMATLAVVIAVAGGSTAIAVSASKAPKNSVRTNSIVNRAITAKKLKQVKGVSNSRSASTDPGKIPRPRNAPAEALAIDGSASASVGVASSASSEQPDRATPGRR